MTLSPTDLTRLAVIIIFAIVLATRDDPRWWHAANGWWSRRVGALARGITSAIRRNRNWRTLEKHRNVWSGQAHNSCARGSTEAVP